MFVGEPIFQWERFTRCADDTEGRVSNGKLPSRNLDRRVSALIEVIEGKTLLLLVTHQ